LTDFRFGTVASLLHGRVPEAEPAGMVAAALPYLW
jgi:hypothetical protein